ncbi:MAG: hypothetical protein AB1325_01145 [Nitrospirota bacterium]
MESKIGDKTAMTKKQKLFFMWIDDESERDRAAENLERLLHVDVEFKDVRGKNLITELHNILGGIKPDLILIDHRLDKVLADSVVETGSSVAEIIREKWPACPIVCVTAARSEDVDLHKKSIYEDLYEYPQLSEHYPSLLSIAESYRHLIQKRPQNNEDLIKSIKPPADDKNRLITIMPENIKQNYNDNSLLFNISKWVRHVLMSKPGFLYDQLWTATLLGLKANSFNKVKNIFDKAKYRGIFADTSKERWWQTGVRQILYSRFSNETSSYPWLLGRKLSGITKRDYSICHVCHKELPDTVGYTDEAAKTPVPMHRRCSITHPAFESSLYVEEIRMMKAAE